MKNNEIKCGDVFRVKVSGKLTNVAIWKEHESGDGWYGVNLATQKTIRIKTAARLRRRVDDPDGTIAGKWAKKPAPASKSKRKAKAKEQRDTGEPDATVAIPADRLPADGKKLSLLKAAEIVLDVCVRSMTCKEIVAKAIDTGAWIPGEGKTPANTLSAAMRREIKVKGEASRFALAGRGLFVHVDHQ